MIKIGDKIRCTRNINNVFGQALFIIDEIYEVLYIDIDEKITLNHILYANEYIEYDMDFVIDNFEKI